MPTILRFRNFRITIFINDHAPAHVHAIGGGDWITFNLGCWRGPITRRENKGVKPADERAIAAFLLDNYLALCRVWEAMHGDPTSAA